MLLRTCELFLRSALGCRKNGEFFEFAAPGGAVSEIGNWVRTCETMCRVNRNYWAWR